MIKMQTFTRKKQAQGFTLVETVVSVAIFVTVFLSLYGVYSRIFTLMSISRLKTVAVALANEQLEIARNLPYANVGTQTGIPNGSIPASQTLARGNATFTVTTVVRNIDDPFDGSIGGVPNDTAPADYKLVDITVVCATCANFTPIALSTYVAPKNLDFSSSDNGALLVHVFDANGQPVSDAAVHIENNSVTPAIVIDDVTGANGTLQLIDVPPGTEVYEVTATKSAYSTDETYPAGAVGNPNPTKRHATVAPEQVTSLSLSIDRLSTITFSSVIDICAPVADIDFHLSGSRLIGTEPDVLKSDASYVTNASGIKTLSSVEWDTYNFSLTDGGYDLAGSNPLLPLAITPNSSQNVQLTVIPKDPRSLMVTVRDAATGLPISGASVVITGVADATLITGRGSITQTDWSGGDGQATSTNPAGENEYFSSDGNVDVSSPSGEVKLLLVGSEYVSSGTLVSSAFDTGSPSNFQTIIWQPSTQPSDAGADSVRVQVATNSDAGTWNFLGPDGTAGSYYTIADTNINAVHNNNRYFRYKLFLATATTSVTPSVSDVSFTFTSACVPPGQVIFTGLNAGTVDIAVSKSGYQTATSSVSVINNWQSTDIPLSP